MRAIIEFRNTADPETLLRVGGAIATHISYKPLVWRAPFPKRFNELLRSGNPYYGGMKKELAWAVSTIRAYSKEITEFVSMRTQVEQGFLTKDATHVADLLTDLERRFGTSIWLTDNLLNCIQTLRGIAAKNRLLNPILSDRRVPPIIRHAISWLAYRASADVTSAEIDRLLADAAPLRDGVDYLFHALLGRCPRIDAEAAGQMLSHTDVLPAIDRYQLLLLTLQAFLANNPADGETAAFVVRMLDALATNINDAKLDRLRFAWGAADISLATDPFLLSLIEDYNCGSYGRVMTAVTNIASSELSVEAINLALRAALLSKQAWKLPKFADESKPLIAEVAADLALVSDFTEDGVEARNRLQKIALTFSGAAWSSSLALILERQRRDERAFHASPLQAMHGLRAQLEHPSLAFSLPGPTTISRYLRNLLATTPPSLTSELLRWLNDPLAADVCVDDLPAERLARLGALRRARAGDFLGASQTLVAVVEPFAPRLAAYEAALLLVRCCIEEGRLADAADIAVHLFLSSRYFGVVLPIQDLVGELLLHHNTPMATSETRGRLSVAIVFDIYSRYVSSDRDAERADAFKDVLRRVSVRKASELPNAIPPLPRDELVYFLRYICVPDVLDQSLVLNSTRAVEDERAAILVALGEMAAEPGRAPPEALKDELREIRTRQVVRETTLRLDQSKVYVNVEGIRRAVDVTMRENFNRYRLMLIQGTVDSLIDNIERIVRTALGEQVTLISLASPLTERTALFKRMVTELRDQFALNKEFGLNSNLSTNIRHGYVLRELRGPLVGRNLITNKHSESGSYRPNTYWLDRLPEWDESSAPKLTELLADFSRRVDDQIDRLNRDLLRIRSENNPEGLFDYTIGDLDLRMLESGWSQIESYDAFIDAVFEFLWLSTERNVARVRENLLGPVLSELNNSINALEVTLRESGLEGVIPALMSAITIARPELRSAVERVASWFAISSNYEYQDFDLEIAYHAALQTVKTYYANVDIISQYVANRPLILKGWCLPIFVRLFDLILDNAAFHGAQQRNTLAMSAMAEADDGVLLICIRNDLPPDHDLKKLTARIAMLNSDYGQEKAVDLVGEEGGSGYPKIWKLLHFDLRMEHTLRVQLEGNEFVVEIRINAHGIL